MEFLWRLRSCSGSITSAKEPRMRWSEDEKCRLLAEVFAA